MIGAAACLWSGRSSYPVRGQKMEKRRLLTVGRLGEKEAEQGGESLEKHGLEY